MALKLNTRLSHYHIKEKIGGGGMGQVYLAYDTRLERDVAVKVLPPGTLSDDAARRRFRREALAVSKLTHPNIATVFDFDTQDGTDFLVMELVGGENLSDKLRSGPLPEKEVLRLGMDLAEGLAAAHAHGVVHRDLKPANIRLAQDGRLKILDFGLAKKVPLRGHAGSAGSWDTETLTGNQTLIGTLPYMAPEQAVGGDVDARSDVWAAGLVLYEMATGRRAFPQTDTVQLILAIVEKDPPDLGALNPRLSAGLEAVIGRCLQKDPGQRYTTGRELAADLVRLSTGVPLAEVRGRRRPRLSRPLLLGAGAIAVLALGLLVARFRDLPGIGSASRIRSLAVLPLANLSGDAGQEYVADGITDGLIGDLARIGDLRVISRTSSMRYKKTQSRMRDIARELGVRGVIEGSVIRSGDRVRVSVQLVDARDDRPIWSRSYDREMSDVLVLQGEVAGEIANEIQAVVSPQTKKILATRRVVDPRAYEDYLLGRYHWNKRTIEDFRSAVACFDRAIARDSTYAAAYGGLAMAYALMEDYDVMPARESYPRARKAALRAIALDPQLADGYVALAYVRLRYDWDLKGAGAAYRKAIEVSPNFSTAHQWYSEYLQAEGRHQEALAEMETARQLDPLSLIVGASLADRLAYAHRLDDAVAAAQKVLQIEPNFWVGHYVLGEIYFMRGDVRSAVQEGVKVGSLVGFPERGVGLLHAYETDGKRGAWRKSLEYYLEDRKAGRGFAIDVARAYSQLGERDSAFVWLDRAIQKHEGRLILLRIEWFWEPIRSDPRFAEVLRRVGLDT